ncbi:MAG: cupin domain-containing protein [Lishizhenia sp.]
MRINELIEKFNLNQHPEGGWYKEIYRSSEKIDTQSGDRDLLTSIYFLLSSDNQSHFHKIESDEIWFYHEGSPLSVHTISPEGEYKVLKVGLNLAKGEEPQVLVPKGTIFGSTVDQENSYSFVSCAVAPGFDFQDFYLHTREELLTHYPEHASIINRLTKA